DPDVMLIGEIRDKETAATAVTASTTGHLVLSTLHTNTAIGAVSRLNDLGIRPTLIADSLIGVLSQRLVRKVCANCRVAYRPAAWEKAYFNDPGLDKLYKGKGCEVCGETGYFGRTLIYEIFKVNKELSRLIEKEADLSVLAAKAAQNGYVDIFDITAKKVKMGVTAS
ncbi:MAG: Flp pilus assembly complex ATPase component, partial [bacterium]|nr:Flp pilus assembly complex ATPase component [bacterium]